MECVIVAIWITCGVLGMVIGQAKGAGGLGFTVGFLLGPLGVLIACFLPEPKKATARRGGYRPEYPANFPDSPQASDDDPLGFLR